MQTFFRVEGPFYRVMMKVWCLLVLNLLMLLTSLPIITIGAAQTAGFTVTTRMISSDETQIVSTFFASFRKNLKQSTITWLLLMVVSGVLVTNWLYLINFQLLNNWMTIGVLIVTLFVANSCQYVFLSGSVPKFIERDDSELGENLNQVSIPESFIVNCIHSANRFDGITLLICVGYVFRNFYRYQCLAFFTDIFVTSYF